MNGRRQSPLCTLGLFAAVVVLVVLALKLTSPPAKPLPTTERSAPSFAAHAEPRSGKWPAVRQAYLEAHPNCEACGRSAKQSGQAIEVHHRLPFHDDPAKELDPANLIALCRRCHELIGHLDSWKSYNPAVREDADRLSKKIKERP